ncbi:PAS domain S-box protein, partial [Coleofasciculus sp. FACHB-712]|uniref:PAS domain S-box protein n=1 Tax=Coleofasciculus sp. FACHB-712 TaxID=2692789 RepID=UPI001685D0F3
MESSYQPIEVPQSSDLIGTLQSFSKKATIAVIAIGCAVLLGWMFNIPILKSILPGLVTMKANAAVCFILSGTSLWLWHRYPADESKRRLGQWFAGIVMVVGLLTLMQYVLGWDFGIDQLLFKASSDTFGTSSPGRMAPNTALNFLMLGVALLLFLGPYINYQAAQILSLAAFSVALLGVLGYLYGVKSLYGISSYTQMALHAAVGFALLSTGILFARPDRGVMAVVTSQNAGGMMARRMSPAVLGIPPLLGWIILAGYRAKSLETEIAISVLGSLNIIVFAVLIWWNSRNLNGIDIKRQRAEAELRTLNQELEQRIDERTAELTEANQERDRFFTLSLDLLCIIGFDGTFKRLNPSWTRILGFAVEELLAQPFIEFIHPDDRDKSLAEAEKLTIGSQVLYFENRYRCKDGSYRWLAWTANAAAENQVMYCIARDITSSKQAEAALRESQERLEAIIDNYTAVIYLKDLEGRYILVNRQYERLFHTTKEQVIGKTDYDFFSKEIADAYGANDRQVLETGTSLEMEEVAPQDDGLHTYLSTKFLLRNSTGTTYALCGISTDISDRKRTEEALQQQVQMLDLANDTIMLRDLDDRIAYWNQGAERLYGWAKEETVGQYIHAFLKTIFPQPVEEIKAACLRDGRWEGELIHTKRDGTQIVVASRWTLQREESGQPKAILEINNDITERRAAEETIRQNEERYRSLIVATSQIVWATDAQGQVVDMPAWRAFTGQSEEQVKGWGWLDAVHPEDRDPTARIWNKALETKSLYQVEYRIRAADGSYGYFWVRGIPVLAEDGSIREWVGVCTDISDRKQAEADLQRTAADLARSSAELRQQTSILQLVLNSMGEAVIVADETGKFLLFNPAAEKMFGLGSGDAPPDRWSTQYGLFLPDTVTVYPTADLPMTKAIRGEAVDDVEMFTRHPGIPEGLWAKINGRPLKDDNGVLKGGAIVCRNITSDKQAQERLQQLAKEQERLLQELKNRQNALDESAIVSETDLKGTITYANERFCQISGYTQEELMGQNHRIVNSGYHPKSFFQDFWATVYRGGVWKGEIKNKRKDGSLYWVDTTVSPIFDTNGNIIKYIGIRFDITQQKEAADRLIKLAEERKIEADSLTQQVVKLLGEIKGAAKGDLTVKAQVTNDILGALADSFNYLVTSLRKVVINIQDAAAQANQATTASIGNTNELAQQARTQALQIESTLKQIERMLNSIKDVSDAAKRAEQVAQQAATTAEMGGQAVDRTVDGINELRQTIAETSKMMKRLGEGSQQIGKIVTSISQIASQTNLLALNATIEAARAGEQGQGFAVVAEEVRKLAERSASATEEISEIVKTIQDEISRVMRAMESGTQQVVEGTHIAAAAKTNLIAIIEVSREINALVQNITRAAQKQTISAEEIAGSVKQVN